MRTNLFLVRSFSAKQGRESSDQGIEPMNFSSPEAALSDVPSKWMNVATNNAANANVRSIRYQLFSCTKVTVTKDRPSCRALFDLRSCPRCQVRTFRRRRKHRDSFPGKSICLHMFRTGRVSAREKENSRNT